MLLIESFVQNFENIWKSLWIYHLILLKDFQQIKINSWHVYQFIVLCLSYIQLNEFLDIRKNAVYDDDCPTPAIAILIPMLCLFKSSSHPLLIPWRVISPSLSPCSYHAFDGWFCDHRWSWFPDGRLSHGLSSCAPFLTSFYFGVFLLKNSWSLG